MRRTPNLLRSASLLLALGIAALPGRALVLDYAAPDGTLDGLDLSAARAAARPVAETTTDRLIIRYHAGTAGARGNRMTYVAATHAAVQAWGLDMRVLRRNAFGAHVVRLNRTLSLDAAQQVARSIQAHDWTVASVEVDRRLSAQAAPNDPYYANQWHYFEPAGGINLPAAWTKSTGSGVVVGVIDTGVRPHADLAANLLSGYDFITNTTVANDGDARDADAADPGDGADAGACGAGSGASNSSWHGTHVSGTIAAVTNNNLGVAGIAYDAKVVPLRVLGRCGGYTSDIADAIVWGSGGGVSGLPANAHPAQVLNLSLGGSGACSATLQSSIAAARGRGTVVVVAAGNSNAPAGSFNPANCPGVIAVAATNRQGGRAYYSNYGSLVTIAAPGGAMSSSGDANGILSTLNDGARAPGNDIYAYYQGTSMATPHVVGIVALMMARNPTLTPDDVVALIRGNARAFPAACSQCGAGIIDAGKVVNAAMLGTSVPTLVQEAEPNDDQTKAQVISTFPAKVIGTMASASDLDTYKVTLAAHETLTARLIPNYASNYDLVFRNGAGALLQQSTNATGLPDRMSITNNTSAAVAYYVRVRYASGLTGANGRYTLELSK